MLRFAILIIITLSIQLNASYSRQLKPQESLPQIINLYGEGPGLKFFIENEGSKLSKISDVLNGNIEDTVFTISQLRLYDFLKRYTQTQNNLPLNNFSSKEVAKYAVEYMRSLESQRKTADVIYDHVKQKAANWLTPEDADINSRRLVEGLELLGRGTLRAVIELEAGDIEGLSNKMNEVSIHKILKGLAKIQRKAKELDFQKIDALGEPNWIGSSAATYSNDLRQSFQILMKPIDKRKLTNYHSHLKALVDFQTAYSKLLGGAFEYYVTSGWNLDSELTITNNTPIIALQERWKEIEDIYKLRFNKDLSVPSDQALNWMITDLKEDYFEFRLLLRDLKVISDIPGEITVLSKNKVDKVMDSVVTAWNSVLADAQLSIDTTKASLSQLVELGIPKIAKSLLGDQLANLDSIYQNAILSEMGWAIDQLDSLIMDEPEKQKLTSLVATISNHLDQIEKIIEDPKILGDQILQNYELRTEWQGNSKVRYVLIEKSEIANNQQALIRVIPTGIKTPWINIDPSLWEKDLDDFTNEWNDQLNGLQLLVNQEIETWLKSHGFPGELVANFNDLEVSGGIPFPWLGRQWKLSFGSTASAQGDTILFNFNDLDDPEFWSTQIEKIAQEEFDAYRNQIEVELKDYWKLLVNTSDITIPEDIQGYLRGDQLVYTYDAGNFDQSLTGATLTFVIQEDSYEINYDVPEAVLIGKIQRLIPHIEIRDLKQDETGIHTKIWFAFDINNPIYIGDFKIFKNGQITAQSLNQGNVLLTLDGNFKIKLIGPSFENNTLKWSNIVFQDIPYHLSELKELNAELGLKISFLPEFDIQFDHRNDSKEILSRVLTSSLNTRGLLPPGVKVKDVKIDKNGIYPRFEIDPKLQQNVEAAINTEINNLCTEIEKVGVQILQDVRVIEFGKQAEAIYANVESWKLDEKANAIEVLKDVIQSPEDPQAVSRLMALVNNDDQIVLESGMVIEIDERNNAIEELGLIIDGFDCDGDPVITIEFDDNGLQPNIDKCLGKFIESLVNSEIDDDNVSIVFQANQMRLVVSGFSQIVNLEMYVGLDGKVSWNYSAEDIASAIIEPYLNEVEEIATEQLQNLGLEVTNDLVVIAENVLNEWENVLSQLGFSLINRPQLEQQLRSASDPIALSEMELNAKITAMSGMLTGTTIENVGLKISNGLIPDFSKCTANLNAVRNRINEWSSTLLQIDKDPILSEGVISARLLIQIPDFNTVPVNLRIDLSKGRVETSSWEDLLMAEIVKVINQKLLPHKMNNSDVSIELVSASNSSAKLIIKCIVTVSTGGDFDFPIPASLIIDFDSGKVEISEDGDLKSLFMGVAGEVLQVLSLPLLEGNKWLKSVDLYPKGGIPEGIIVTGEAPLWGVAKIEIPGLIISHKGVRLGEAGIKINFGGARAPIPPFELVEPAGEIKGTNLSISAKLTVSSPPSPIPESERIIYAKGTFTVDLKKPLRWTTQTDLVALQVFNLGYSRQVLDIGKGTYEMEIDFGGPLKEIIAIQGNGKLEAKGPRVNAYGKMLMFGEPMATGVLKLDLANQTIYADSKIDIPVTGSVGSHFSTGRHFSNPTIGATETFKILKFELGGTKFLVSPNIASANFSVIGMSMTLQVPGYKQLDEKAFEKLLKNLLSPDFSNIDEALLALLSGDITINPFSGFGPGGGGIGGNDGDGGDGGSSGSSGGNGDSGYGNTTGAKSQSSASAGTGNSAGNLQGNVAIPPVKLETPVVSPTANGTTPALIPGSFSFPLRNVDGIYRVFRTNSQDATENQPLSFIDSKYISDHFISTTGNEYQSAGFFLNASSDYYVHVLKQNLQGSSCPGDHGVVHWYAGKDLGKTKHIEMPLHDLEGMIGSLCYSSLPGRISGDPALGNWLRNFSLAVGNRTFELNDSQLIAKSPGSAFKLSAPSGMYAVAIRFYNSLNHTLIIGTKDGGQVINIPEMHLIANNSSAQTSLLQIAQKHANVGIGLYESGGTLYLYTGCDPGLKQELTYKLVNNAFVLDNSKTTSCEPTFSTPEPKPKPVKKQKPIPSIDAPLVGPGDCPLSLQENNGQIEFICNGDQPFAFAPKSHEAYTLFDSSTGQWLPNRPSTQIWEMGTMLTRYLLNEGEAVLWVQGTSPYNISLLPLGQSGLPSWEKLKPESFEQNVALHGAFSELSTTVGSMAAHGNTIKPGSIEYKESGDVAVFVLQFNGRPDTEYWAFIGNKASKKQLTKKISSGAGSPTTFPVFMNNMNSISQ